MKRILQFLTIFSALAFSFILALRISNCMQGGDSTIGFAYFWISTSDCHYINLRIRSSTVNFNYCLRLPFWPLMLLMLCAPTLLVRLERRKRAAIKQGLCRTCNYDLRAHTSGQKCPECGTTIPLASSTLISSASS